MRSYIRSQVLAVLVVGLFAGGILLSQALGWWSTESRKVARKITTGQFAGKADPADIRGSYTFQDVEKNFGVPVKILAQAFGFENEKDPASVRAKDLETKFAGTSDPQTEPETAFQAPSESQSRTQTPSLPQSRALEIGTDSLRAFVAYYVGIPYTVKEGTGLPEQAFRILKETGRLRPEQEAYLEKIVVRMGRGLPSSKDSLQSSTPVVVEPQGTTKEAQKTSTPETVKAPSSEQTKAVNSTTIEPLIKGKTTFKEVLAWGVTKAQIEKVLGRPMPSEGTVIKDWCTKEGLKFSTIRDALQKLKP
jgi:hypothetical protein